MQIEEGQGEGIFVYSNVSKPFYSKHVMTTGGRGTDLKSFTVVTFSFWGTGVSSPTSRPATPPSLPPLLYCYFSSGSS